MAYYSLVVQANSHDYDDQSTGDTTIVAFDNQITNPATSQCAYAELTFPASYSGQQILSGTLYFYTESYAATKGALKQAEVYMQMPDGYWYQLGSSSGYTTVGGKSIVLNSTARDYIEDAYTNSNRVVIKFVVPTSQPATERVWDIRAREYSTGSTIIQITT